jgi:transposase
MLHANKHDNIIQEVFLVVNCRKILELYFDGISQRTISSSTGHSRNTVSEVVQRAKKLGLERLNDTMTSQCYENDVFKLNFEIAKVVEEILFNWTKEICEYRLHYHFERKAGNLKYISGKLILP